MSETRAPGPRGPSDAAPPFGIPTSPAGQPLALADATQLLHLEAHSLDLQRWDEWLSLYHSDARFWMPAWTDEHLLSRSPDEELSLMYCAARAGLEDRVWRVRSGLSVASMPLPRTTHVVANTVFAAPPDADRVELRSAWTCHVYELKRREHHAFFGRYEHVLTRGQAGWRIAAKTVVLMNDRIPTMLDFYCV